MLHFEVVRFINVLWKAEVEIYGCPDELRGRVVSQAHLSPSFSRAGSLYGGL